MAFQTIQYLFELKNYIFVKYTTPISFTCLNTIKLVTQN